MAVILSKVLYQAPKKLFLRGEAKQRQNKLPTSAVSVGNLFLGA